MKRFFWISTLLLCALGSLSAQERVAFSASYTGDWMSNLRGGIKTGSGYLGMATMGVDVRLWKGAQLHAMGVNTHGDQPSATLIGDMQGASNIEAENRTYFQEAWLRQRLGSVELTLGLQDMAVELGNVEYAGLYLNSSLGVKSTISHNVPAPIFPLTSLGLTAKWTISPRLTWVAAVYDGDQSEFETHSSHQARWMIQRDDDLLGVTELQLHGSRSIFKLGMTLHGGNTSFYANAHRRLSERLGAFVQLGYAPHEQTSDHYVGAGMNAKSLIFDGDQAGLAVAHEHFPHVYDRRAETAVELTWKLPALRSGFFVQPDLQYIIDPAGTSTRLNNALVATIRFGWEL